MTDITKLAHGNSLRKKLNRRITAGILDCFCTGRLLYREVNHVMERHSGSMRRG
ncbi:hypothetical protein S13a_00054 [Klebsiella phage VLCpiS13a]|uniref:hypothetical protein n=1 Tax=Klebsiella phage VLCpiS13a TaxID=2874885 RepID=UPI00233F434A|nr:hypothetical protein PRB89_gp47 [Klebsiella phage VLCpiS13a]UVX30260.1 hypothetical protein S13a_00054 [Klebsiella phage VLCpiS13a]